MIIANTGIVPLRLLFNHGQVPDTTVRSSSLVSTARNIPFDRFRQVNLVGAANKPDPICLLPLAIRLLFQWRS